MELVKVTNVWIKLTTGEIIPVLRAVMRDMPTSISSSTLNSLYDQIYTLSSGMTCTLSARLNRHVPIPGFTTNGTFTYGDNTGFKITYKVNNTNVSGIQTASVGYDAGLYFKGRNVTRAYIYTGYGNYEYSFIVMFTDENYHVYTAGSNSYPFDGIYVTNSAQMTALEKSGNNLIAIVPTGGVRQHRASTMLNIVADEDIRSYIVREDDPTLIDPFSPGGTSEPGGGGGSFDDNTDVITEPSYDPVELLNRSYGNRGFVHVYLPTMTELNDLHTFMWDASLWAQMQKMFGNVADSVISLNLIPLDFTDETPNRGNILLGVVDSEIETTIAKQQFVSLDCGTIEINEFFASYLDYSPYSKLQIFLPYIGVKDLDIDEFMNAYINVKYVIDIVSGSCVAFISKSGAIDNDVVKDNPILGVLYQFAGNCALNVPISGANYAQVHAADIGAIISGAGIVGAFATGGMSAPAAVTGVLSTAANVITSKPSISRGGSIPSTAGYMGVQKPYLILTRPRMCLPEDQNTFTGYPAYVTLTPGDTSGYTEFEEIHLENIPATDAEKDEIMNLMKTGVVL